MGAQIDTTNCLFSQLPRIKSRMNIEFYSSSIVHDDKSLPPVRTVPGTEDDTVCNICSLVLLVVLYSTCKAHSQY